MDLSSQVTPDDVPSLYAWAGGRPALTRMTTIFYETYVPADPLLSLVFAGMSPDHPQRVAAWLGETFGGPPTYTTEYGGYPHMVREHLDRALTEAQRARWVQLLTRAADDAGLPADPEFRAAFVSYLEWGSRIAVENSTPGATPPMNMPVPRWSWVAGATPGSRVSALDRPAAPATPALPAADASLGFATHIQPLFRPVDRQSMRFAFDLWAHADVSQHAEAILARLQAGTMPCDGPWDAAAIGVFEAWMAAGTPA